MPLLCSARCSGDPRLPFPYLKPLAPKSLANVPSVLLSHSSAPSSHWSKPSGMSVSPPSASAIPGGIAPALSTLTRISSLACLGSMCHTARKKCSPAQQAVMQCRTSACAGGAAGIARRTAVSRPRLDNRDMHRRVVGVDREVGHRPRDTRRKCVVREHTLIHTWRDDAAPRRQCRRRRCASGPALPPCPGSPSSSPRRPPSRC